MLYYYYVEFTNLKRVRMNKVVDFLEDIVNRLHQKYIANEEVILEEGSIVIHLEEMEKVPIKGGFKLTHPLLEGNYISVCLKSKKRVQLQFKHLNVKNTHPENYLFKSKGESIKFESLKDIISGSGVPPHAKDIYIAWIDRELID